MIWGCGPMQWTIPMCHGSVQSGHVHPLMVPMAPGEKTTCFWESPSTSTQMELGVILMMPVLFQTLFVKV